MSFTKLVFITYAIYMFCLTDNVSALSEESILGGIPVSPLQFKHQVSVQGIKNFTIDHVKFGGGALVSETHVVSAASVFLLSNGNLKEWSFSVVVGTHDLDLEVTLRVAITRIYFPNYEKNFMYFNLAVAKLTRKLHIGVGSLMTALDLPTPGQQFEELNAKVSGFGLFHFETQFNTTTGQPYVSGGNLSSILRYRNVYIVTNAECGLMYDKVIAVNNVCGLMYKEYDTDEVLGVCKGDAGNPLVIDNVLVGIVSTTPPDCNNVYRGALYTRVSNFVHNIQAFLLDPLVLPKDAFYRDNLPYVQPVNIY